jgi:hypothetical protein
VWKCKLMRLLAMIGKASRRLMVQASELMRMRECGCGLKGIARMLLREVEETNK